MTRKILFVVLIIVIISSWGRAETFISLDNQVILKKEGIFLIPRELPACEGGGESQVQRLLV